MVGIWSPEETERIVGGNVNDGGHAHERIAGVSLQRLVGECANLAKLLASSSLLLSSSLSSRLTSRVPTIRYGRTGIRMPIVSLGCMRFQQTWNSASVSTPDQVNAGCQDNLLRILRHAVRCGIVHVKTARAYGCSKLQIGIALRALFEEGTCRREDLIVQTKGVISSTLTMGEYKLQILKQIECLGLDYVDLFSVHGVNMADHVDWLFRRGEERGGNLIDAVRELRDMGRVQWIRFLTHAPAHVIRGIIKTDAFNYVNRE